MKVYIDITLLPSDDIGQHFLWEKVYQQVHLALVENQDSSGVSTVGIGFPEFNAERNRLGRKLRLFAPARATLEKLNLPQWLSRLTDYVHMTHIRDVPEKVKGYERFSRFQVKSGVERLARRAAKRGGGSFEDALNKRSGLQPKSTKAPYVWIKSLSNDNRFRLFIRREDAEPTIGFFNGYGLSKDGVLPLF